MSYSLDQTATRSDFVWFRQAPIRWGDNDQYGHLNNARYYSLFENAIMYFLEIESGLDVHGEVQCFTVENGCKFLLPMSYPEVTETGLRVAHLGNSSVKYELGVFVEGEAEVRAVGFGVDVFVDTESGKPVRIPDNCRDALARLSVKS